MDSHRDWAAAEGDRAVRFTGNWREYLPIAATNALLIVCTLGIYRFWAAARQRRYLWSHTVVIDDTLEWSGTGKEMFLGFLIVIAVLAPFFLVLQFLFPALIARGKIGIAGGVMFFFYVALIYLGGFARFRALRYRLSRSWWHGIRGGSDNPGWRYGAEYLGRYALSALTLFIVFPWAATRLWNSRWNAMSFGALEFRSNLTAEGLKGRWALIYLPPPGVLLLGGMAGAVAAASLRGQTAPSAGLGLIFVGAIVIFYIGLPLLTLNWFAAYYRKAASATSLGDLEFGFEATTLQWLGLFLGNLALAVVTLGFGLTYWGYRNWSFMVRHSRLYGTIEVSSLTQSTTHAPREAEGFADAFDVGAI
jgi:uncharacterized membrane protein YjgN (DUF898 family)